MGGFFIVSPDTKVFKTIYSKGVFLNNILNIERAVLSAVVFEPDQLEKVSLRPEQFMSTFHQNLFTVMKELKAENKPIDEIFIKERLSEKGQFNELDMLDMLSATPVSAIGAYVEKIREISRKRAVLRLTTHIREDIESLSYAEITSLLELELRSADRDASGLPPLHSIKNVKAQPPVFYLEYFLPIQKKEINVFSSKGGLGKSYVALLVACMLVKKHHLKVFAHFSEDAVGVTKKRFDLLKKTHSGLGNVSFDLWGKEARPLPFVQKDRSGNYSPTEYWYKFKRKFADYDVIVLDPLIPFLGSDENSNTEARFLFDLLNEWCEVEDKTIILIHHHNKDDRLRGASAIIDALRMHYVVGMVEGNPDARSLELGKSNHYFGKKHFEVNLFSPTHKKKRAKIVKKNESPKRMIVTDAVRETAEALNIKIEVDKDGTIPFNPILNVSGIEKEVKVSKEVDDKIKDLEKKGVTFE